MQKRGENGAIKTSFLALEIYFPIRWTCLSVHIYTNSDIFKLLYFFLHKSVFSLFTRTKPSSDVHSPKPLVFSPAGLFNMVLRLTESTQTREIKRAVSYGNKRTGPKKLGKKA